MKRYYYLLITFLTLFSMTNSWAAPGLIEVFDLATQYDPEFAGAKAARRAGQEAVPQARAALLPQIQASTSLSHTQRTLETTRSSSEQRYNSKSTTLSLSQVLYDRQAFLTRYQANARVAYANLEESRAWQTLALRTVQAYTELLYAEASVELADAKKAAFAEQFQQAEQQYKGGAGTIIDVQEAQAQQELANAEVLAASSQLRIKQQALYKLTGQAFEQVAPLSGQAPMPPPKPNQLAHWLTEANKNALEIQLASKAFDVSQYDVRRARSEHLPRLKLVGRGQWQENVTVGYTEDNPSSIGVELAIPLFEGGRVNSVTRENVAKRDQAAEQLRAAKLETESQVTEAFHGVNDSIAHAQALKQAVKSAEIALDAAKIGFNVGYRTSVDVLNSHQQVFLAKQELLRERHNYLLQWLNLKATTGLLKREDLKLIDQWLSK